MYPEKIVQVACNLREQGLSIRKISELLEISKSCIHQWFHKPKEKPPVPKKEVPAREELFGKVSQCIQENPDMSIRGIAAQVGTSKSSTHRMLTKLGYRKKKVYQVGSNDVKRIASLREAFSKRIEQIQYESVISIDETCIYERITPTRRWTNKPGRIYLPIQRLESRKHSLIVASTHEKIIHAVLVKGSVNTDIFNDFIAGIPSNNSYLLMDNVAFHKTEKVTKSMEEKGFKALYTSPYSPEWNPVEMFFSYLKRAYRKFYNERTIAIKERIQHIIKSIDSSIFNGWYQHVWEQIKTNFHR